jgi:hypothetical protein
VGVWGKMQVKAEAFSATSQPATMAAAASVASRVKLDVGATVFGCFKLRKVRIPWLWRERMFSFCQGEFPRTSCFGVSSLV